MADTKIGNYDALHIEENTLKYWKDQDIYPKKIHDKVKGKTAYYFLDGPPYTSGKVHIGTAWNKSLKDCVLRYKWMNNFEVWDRAGYDMHGLPTEHATEKKLKLSGKEDIEKFGVEKFIEECKTLCKENMAVMNEDFTRIGSWMDYPNAYQSITQDFVEGEWWLIKKAHENNRLYEGKRTMTWCASCATAVAKHELEYQEVNEKSIFLKMPVEGEENTFLVIWTTTPWTIPFNLAIMVNPELDYQKVKVDGEHWILAKALAAMMVRSVANKDLEVEEEFKGEKLEGMKYIHPLHKDIKFFEEHKDNPKLHTVLMSAEYVDTSAGTGLVHCAPGCGPQDYEIGHANGLPTFNNLDEHGIFRNMGKYDGWKAKNDDKKFIEELEKTGMLVGVTDVEHDYAHCWRCHDPVVFRATTQWFFKVEDLKEKMLEENEKIKWIPDAAYNAFKSWLNNLRDNSITKQRYWGTPLPVWKCDKCDNYVVLSTVKEIEDHWGQKLKDFHKPYIDEVEFKCECGGNKKRIPDILDVWVDAGCASWNCLDYPHKTENFEKLFPAEFILEGKDQIRGWFNLLLVASMVSMGKPSFKKCYMHGFVQDAQGRKMSKSLGNYILPEEVINKYGADTLRYYTIGGANPATDLNYNFDDMKLKHKNLGVLWNLHKYLLDYSKNLGIKPADVDEKLVANMMSMEEKYILSKMNSAIKAATAAFEEYLLNDVPWVIEELYLELSRTYIQLVREKAASGEDLEKQAVLYTLNKVMTEILKLFAPIVPFITEQMYHNMKNAFGLKEESIHLCDWPKADESMIDEQLEKDMSIAKSVVQAVLAAREKAQMGVRWPLKEAIISTKDENVIKAIENMKHSIMIQTNVKDVVIKDKVEGVKTTLKANVKNIGPVYGELIPGIISKLASDSPEKILSRLEKEKQYTIKVDGKEVHIVKEFLIIGRELPAYLNEGQCRHGLVFINKERTEELDAEGYARELTRRVQVGRKNMGLEKKDDISLFVQTDDETVQALKNWTDHVKEKVGATQINISSQEPSKEHKFKSEEKVKDIKFNIFID